MLIGFGFVIFVIIVGFILVNIQFKYNCEDERVCRKCKQIQRKMHFGVRKLYWVEVGQFSRSAHCGCRDFLEEPPRWPGQDTI